jgi:hypothetical protein
MINTFWSVLNRGVTCPTGRQVSLGIYSPVDKYSSLHNMLVPASDIAYSSCASEQILQAVLNSSYKDKLYALDPMNTYEHPLTFPMNTAMVALPSVAVGVSIIKESDSFNWISNIFNVQIHPGDSTASVSGLGGTKEYTYSVTNNLSSKIPLDTGLYVRMTGPIPESDFAIHVQCEIPFNRSIKNIISLESAIWYNAEYRKLYTQETNPVEKVAILAFNLYEGIINGR